MRPALGQDLGGDRAITREIDGTLLLAIIDVLGHGPQADGVARVAADFLANAPARSAEALLRSLDAELAGSVGAAAGIATLSPEPGRGSFAGIGNTVCKVLGDNNRTLVSADGVVGQRAGALRSTPIHVNKGETLLMHTDGISSRIDWPERFPEITHAEPELAAGEIIRRFGRPHDDAACIVARPAP